MSSYALRAAKSLSAFDAMAVQSAEAYIAAGDVDLAEPWEPDDHRLEPTLLPPFFASQEKIVGQTSDLFERNTPAIEPLPALADWHGFMSTLVGINARGQIAGSHGYIRRSRARDVIAGYARAILWQAPPALWTGAERAVGAAEAKYISLRLLGFHADRLRVTIGETDRGEPTALLTVLYDDDFWALTETAIDPLLADDVTDFRPTLSVNERDFRLHWRDDERERLFATLGRMEACAG